MVHNSRDYLFPQPDSYDPVRRLTRRLLYLVAVILLVTAILLAPGIDAYLHNRQLDKIAVKYQDHERFTTTCHLIHPEEDYFDHYCQAAGFTYLLNDLRAGDVVLMQFIFSLHLEGADEASYLDSRLTIFDRNTQRGLYSGLTMDISTGSYTYEVASEGDYGLYIQPHPTMYPNKSYTIPSHYTLVVDLSIAVTPQRVEYPLRTWLAWLPLVVLIVCVRRFNQWFRSY